MQASYVLGLVGSLTLALGVFLPILSAPILGSLNYFHNGSGDGVLVLGLAFVSFLLTLRRRYEWLLTAGVVSLAIVVATAINVLMSISGIHAHVESTLAGNPFKGLTETALQSVQLQWGWIVLVFGSAMLIAASARRREGVATSRTCPFCAEPIQARAKICKHCKSELTADSTETVVASPAPRQFPVKVLVVTLCVMLLIAADVALYALGGFHLGDLLFEGRSWAWWWNS